jgi:thiol-disulfide isomerase/thioredoxin
MKKRVHKEIIEWAIFLGVIGFLFATGLHTTVFGTIQRGLLATGIIRPDLNDTSTPASYDLTLVDIDGNELNLDEWKDETIFMNYWATWCPPCIAEMPDINSLYGKTGEKVKFAMISVDNDPQKAIDFVKRKGFDFPIYFIRSGIPRVYQSRSIPTTYVISPKGEIVVTNKGMAQYSNEGFVNFLLGLSNKSSEIKGG